MLKKPSEFVSLAAAGRWLAGTMAAGFLAWGTLPAATADTGALASDWSRNYNAQTRLIAGSAEGAAGPHGYAGVEIRMDPGWKTYWKYPGDAGGVPPVFDWSGSENLKSAKVLYPAPHRLSDASGDAIGYKDGVVFPVIVQPREPGEPVQLKVKIDYGICREICIPAESSMTLTIPPGNAPALPAELAAAIDLVPRVQDARRPNDPELKSMTLAAAASPPKLTIEAAFPGGAIEADAFVEGPDGIYLPLPRKVGKSTSGATLFEIDLEPDDIADLQGKPLTVTLVAGNGQSQASLTPAVQSAAR